MLLDDCKVEYIILFLLKSVVIKFFGYLDINYMKDIIYRWYINLFGIIVVIFIEIKIDIYR